MGRGWFAGVPLQGFVLFLWRREKNEKRHPPLTNFFDEPSVLKKRLPPILGSLINFEQEPLYIKVLVWLAKFERCSSLLTLGHQSASTHGSRSIAALCPKGRAMIIYWVLCRMKRKGGFWKYRVGDLADRVCFRQAHELWAVVCVAP